MSLLDKLFGEFVDVIDFTDDTKDTIVWRFERHGNEIKYGAKLTVREGQAAVFIHEGQLADVFGPGMYELKTNNMPRYSSENGANDAVSPVERQNRHLHASLSRECHACGEKISSWNGSVSATFYFHLWYISHYGLRRSLICSALRHLPVLEGSSLVPLTRLQPYLSLHLVLHLDEAFVLRRTWEDNSHIVTTGMRCPNWSVVSTAEALTTATLIA